MKNFVVPVVLLAMSLSCFAADIHPPHEIVFKTIGEVHLKLHVFEPEGHQADQARPAIVFFFGGGWKGFSPQHFYPHSAYLASRGMVAICAEYRTENEHGTTPDRCVEDGKSALRYVRAHADDLGIDPDRIAAGGGSAGGHVAAATATAEGFNAPADDQEVSCRPRALVLFNPVFDNGPDGWGHDRVKEYWEDFSPIHNIDSNTPPTLVMIGSEDPLVPVATVERFQRLMNEHGRRCEIRVYEGQKHGFFNVRNPEYFRKTVREMDLFLRSLGYLEGEPTIQNQGQDGSMEDASLPGRT